MQHFTEQFDLAAVCWVKLLRVVATLFSPLQQGDLQVRLTGVGDWHSKRSREQGLTCLCLWPLPAYTSSCENFSLHLDSAYGSGRCQRLGWGGLLPVRINSALPAVLPSALEEAAARPPQQSGPTRPASDRSGGAASHTAPSLRSVCPPPGRKLTSSGYPAERGEVGCSRKRRCDLSLVRQAWIRRKAGSSRTAGWSPALRQPLRRGPATSPHGYRRRTLPGTAVFLSNSLSQESSPRGCRDPLGRPLSQRYRAAAGKPQTRGVKGNQLPARQRLQDPP